MTNKTVTIDKSTVVMLVDFALSELYYADQQPGDAGCCPECCGPCNSLRTLRDSGELDDLMREHLAGKSYMWDDANDQVDRALLARAWRLRVCHAGAGAP